MKRQSEIGESVIETSCLCLGNEDKYLRNNHLSQIMKGRRVSHTIPDKLRHSAQAYRTTEKSKKIIKEYDL